MGRACVVALYNRTGSVSTSALLNLLHYMTPPTNGQQIKLVRHGVLGKKCVYAVLRW